MKNRILDLRKEGKTYNEISKILNCSKGTISYHCKKLDDNNELNKKNKKLASLKKLKNIPYIDFGDDVSDYDFKKVLECRINGNTYDEILEKTNLSLDKIKKICRINNVNDNHYRKSDYCKKYEKYTIEQINDMQLFYDECKSMRQVSKKFNITKYQIYKILNITKKEKLDNKTLKKNKVKAVVNCRRENKRKLVEYKGGCCEKCGYDKCIDAFDFHHMDPNQKDFGISAKSYSFERLKKEVDKCILVCRNCHAELHYEIKNGSIA